MPKATQTGTVAFWRADKGYGRIIADEDGEELFAHFSGIVEGDESGYRSLSDGQRVEFRVLDSIAADDDEDFDDETIRRAAESIRPL